VREFLQRAQTIIQPERTGGPTNQLGMNVKPSALFALASSGQAVSEQKPISERAAKQVKFPVKL